MFTAWVQPGCPLSDVVKRDYDVGYLDRGYASQRWYTWIVFRWLHMKVCFFASRGWKFHSRPETTFGWPEMVCKRQSWDTIMKTKTAKDTGAKDQPAVFLQVLRWRLHTSGPRLMVARSPHAKSCVQKVNVPPPFLVRQSLKTPWSPYSTQRSPGMQWWSHALKSSTDGGLGFWVYSIISMASWSPVKWGHSHRIGFHSNEVITWCVLDSIPQSNFSKSWDTS